FIGTALGNGDGSFGSLHYFAAGNGNEWTTVADLNHDHVPDLVIADSIIGGVTVLLGTGHAQFAPPVDLPLASQQALHVTTADLDHDGNPDLLVTQFNNSQLGVLRGHGDGTFAAPIYYPTGLGPYDLTLADLNHDGQIDVLTADESAGAFSILYGR